MAWGNAAALHSLMVADRQPEMMRPSRALPVVLFLGALGCGSSDSGSEARPIELLYYVSGGPGLEFAFASTADAADCGSTGTGIQARNADHQFGNRVFQTPHLFVLENARQPVRAVIRNLSTVPIQVDLYVGFEQQVGGPDGAIAPGECRTIESASTAGLVPAPRGPETRVEVCSPQNGGATPCAESPGDRNIGFFATTGDLVASTITNCILTPFLDACRSPATFFWENPQDRYNAVMTVNPGQNPGGETRAVVRAELYVNGQLRDHDSGSEAIVGFDP